MLLYNVTTTLDLNIEADWAQWMKGTHIPDVMSTGMFMSYRFCRLLNHEHEDTAIYTTQYLAKDKVHLERYLEEFAADLQKDVRTRYEGKYTVFRTIMEVVDHNERL